MINKSRLVKLLQALIAIKSQNPGNTEKEIALFIQDFFKKLRVPARIYEFKKDRSNVMAYVGRGARHSLLVTPHLDTVPAGKGWQFNPFAGTISQGKLYGVGATDCKVNIAVAMEAIQSLIEEKVKMDYNLIFAATADEETGSDWGLIPLLEKKILKADAALVLDADDFAVVVAQKGLIHLKVILKGKRAHGAYPWRGKNAIAAAVDILAALKSKVPSYRPHKYLRPPTVNIGTIRGGDKVNIVADWCEFELDFRYLPGMSAEDIIQDLKQLIKKHASQYKIEISGIQKDYTINTAHPLVASFVQALKEQHIRPKITGSEGATTITFFQDAHIPAIASGFGCDGCAHTINEYVVLHDVYKGALVLESFLKKYRSKI